MNILLTGSAGFIGFHVSKALLERGDHVIGFDNFNEYYDPKLKLARNALLEQYENFTLMRGDISKKKDLLPAFDLLGTSLTPTRVCHLAAQAGVRHSIENPHIFLQDNVIGFGNVLELCRERGVEGLIYASSSSVYGNSLDLPSKETTNTDAQVSLYGMTKKANELQAHVYHDLYDLQSTGLRFFTVYGPYGRPDMAIFLFTDWIVNKKPVQIFGEGKMQRDFTYIDDIVQGVMAAIDKNYASEIFNLGAGHTEELMDYVRAVESAVGTECKKEFLPMQQGDVVSTAADISKAQKMLNYDPKTRINTGVPKFVEWYKKYYQIGN